MRRKNSLIALIYFMLLAVIIIYRNATSDAPSTHDTEDDLESPSEDFENKYYQTRRGHFISEALIYFIAGGAFMQASQESVSSVDFGFFTVQWFTIPKGVDLGVAILLLAFALVLFVLSFIHRPTAFANSIYSFTSSVRTVPFMIFAISWVIVFAALADKGVTPAFVYPFLYLGFLLILGILAHQIYEGYQNRKQKRKLASVIILRDAVRREA